jgi:LmbE family N-acetylglucosaminyl deacetylase
MAALITTHLMSIASCPTVMRVASPRPRSQIPQIRRAEQTEAAALLGVNDVRFFGLGEGGFRPAGRALHVDLVRVIRQARPQRVGTWSPE